MADIENTAELVSETGTAATVAELVKEHIKPEVVRIDSPDLADPPADILVLPEGLKAHSIAKFIDEFRTAPRQRKGNARFDALDSLIAHANRFKDKDSALFADGVGGDRPSIRAVLNYHRAGAEGDPRFGDHRAVHEFPLSDEWEIWTGKNKAGMDQADFAEFLEDRIADVIVPDAALLGEIKKSTAGGDFGEKTPLEMLADYARQIGGDFATPSRLVELSRGLAVHVGQTVKSAVNIQSGAGEVRFIEEHADAGGAPLKVPNLFLIALPVFLHGPLYRLAVRLRYRVRGGSIAWSFDLYRHDKVFEAAFRESCERAAAETKMPLFYGAPE